MALPNLVHQPACTSSNHDLNLQTTKNINIYPWLLIYDALRYDTYKNSWVSCCQSQGIGTGDSLWACLLQWGFDLVNNFEPTSWVSVWDWTLLANYASTVVQKYWSITTLNDRFNANNRKLVSFDYYNKTLWLWLHFFIQTLTKQSWKWSLSKEAAMRASCATAFVTTDLTMFLACGQEWS